MKIFPLINIIPLCCLCLALAGFPAYAQTVDTEKLKLASSAGELVPAIKPQKKTAGTEKLKVTEVAAREFVPEIQPDKKSADNEKRQVTQISAQDLVPAIQPRAREPWGITPVIIPAYTPETRFALSGGVVYYNYSTPESPKPNQITLYGYGTQNEQACVGMRAERYMDDDNFKLNLSSSYTYYPNEYWGIGSYARDGRCERYTNRSMIINGTIGYKLVTNLYLGLNVLGYHSEVTGIKQNGILYNENPIGIHGTDELGAGWHLCLDSRDMVFFPHTGTLLDLKNVYYIPAFGSKYTFYKLDLNGSHYFRVKGEHVVAFQYMVNLAWGDVPMQLLNYNNIRGYNYSRYIDRDYIGANLEYRFPIIWRLGGAVFAGAGEIAHNVKSFDFKSIKPAVGTGLRLMVDRDEHINVRFDVGFRSLKRCEFYLNIIEAF